MEKYPEDLLNFYKLHSVHSYTATRPLYECWKDSECSHYEIDFQVDTAAMLVECQQIDHLFVNHRPVDVIGGYSHKGWQSITLHGLAPNKTEHYTRYGFTTLEEANYHWTEICEQVPILSNFLKSLPYDMFDRVRIMKLAPQGYIMPHTDGASRMFGPLNFAINNPTGCDFVFENKGIVPFRAGVGMVLDVGRRHMVINNSDEYRYHVIVHGHTSNNFNRL